MSSTEFNKDMTISLDRLKEEHYDRVIGLLIQNKKATPDDFDKEEQEYWGDFEFEVEVSASVTSFVRGRMYMSNGDPGYPDEGGDVEDLTVLIDGTSEDLAEFLKDDDYFDELIIEDLSY